MVGITECSPTAIRYTPVFPRRIEVLVLTVEPADRGTELRGGGLEDSPEVPVGPGVRRLPHDREARGRHDRHVRRDLAVVDGIGREVQEEPAADHLAAERGIEQRVGVAADGPGDPVPVQGSSPEPDRGITGDRALRRTDQDQGPDRTVGTAADTDHRLVVQLRRHALSTGRAEIRLVHSVAAPPRSEDGSRAGRFASDRGTAGAVGRSTSRERCLVRSRGGTSGQTAWGARPTFPKRRHPGGPG
jgi:hypothetical protein